MCQAVLSPNLTKKFQWEVSQIADNRFPCMILLGGLSVNLNHLKMTNLWMPVTSLIMVRFSIRKKFWKALGLLYQMTVETIGKWWGKQQGKWQGKRQGKRRGKRCGKPPKNDQSLIACNFLNNGLIFNLQKVLESSWSPLLNNSRNNRETTEMTGEMTEMMGEMTETTGETTDWFLAEY